jgi:mannose/fructose-specific phosphotransferase system component IIA
MSDTPLAQGIVVAHGVMAEGLVDAVRRIAGDSADALTPLSNEGLGPQELKTALEDLSGQRPTVVFADLMSGSCGMAAFASCRNVQDRAVVCGVNLPLLLDFVFHRDLPLGELVPHLIATGRESVRTLGDTR